MPASLCLPHQCSRGDTIIRCRVTGPYLNCCTAMDRRCFGNKNKGTVLHALLFAHLAICAGICTHIWIRFARVNALAQALTTAAVAAMGRLFLQKVIELADSARGPSEVSYALRSRYTPRISLPYKHAGRS